MKTIHKSQSAAWFTLFLTIRLSPGYGSQQCAGWGVKRTPDPLALGASDHIFLFCWTSFSDVFKEPIFPPLDHITHDITLLEPDAQTT